MGSAVSRGDRSGAYVPDCSGSSAFVVPALKEFVGTFKGTSRAEKHLGPGGMINKIVYGLILGGILGIFDGLTAWFTPAVRSQLLMIVVGSTIKGIIAGVLIGFFAKKVNSLPLGIVFGLASDWRSRLRSRRCLTLTDSTITSRSCFPEAWSA